MRTDSPLSIAVGVQGNSILQKELEEVALDAPETRRSKTAESSRRMMAVSVLAFSSVMWPDVTEPPTGSNARCTVCNSRAQQSL